MIEVKNLTKKFGKTISLDNVSATFNQNDYVALMVLMVLEKLL
jgi:ABC-type multidrug transport system ATPase subunit